MRRMILASLVLLPATAFAHAAANEPQPSSSPANVSAALKTPAAATAITAVSAPSLIHEFVLTEMNGIMLGSEAADVGSRAYSYRSGAPIVTDTPAISRMVDTNVTLADLAARPSVTDVIVHATVDQYGVPRDLAIAKSAGDAIDGKVLAAVAQYRFRPATVDHRPVAASVMISVKIAKP